MDAIIKFKNLLVESLRDNKKLIIGFYIIFIICFVAVWILSASKIQSSFANMPISNTTSSFNDAGALELFIHNASSGIATYFGSILFGIPAIVMLIYNAVNLGAIGQLFNTIMPNGGMRYIIYLIPHGIFEITATVLQSVSGILLFLFVWRFIKAMLGSETQGVFDSFEKTKKALVQSVVILIFSMILLLVAAPIEAYFSVPFSEFVMGG